MDELKKYLQTNASYFEEDTPDTRIWQNIKYQIQTPKKKQTLMLSIAKYCIAACVLFLAGIGAWHLLQKTQHTEDFSKTNQLAINDSNNQKDSDVVIQETIDTPFAIITSTTKNIAKKLLLDTQKFVSNTINNGFETSPTGFVQVRSIDSQFSQAINIQKNIINQTPLFAESPAFFKDFISSYQQMENDEKNVKKDIIKIGLSPDLLEQLINVNQQKLNLLKLLLTEINKTNNRFKQNRNLIDTIKTYFIEI